MKHVLLLFCIFFSQLYAQNDADQNEFLYEFLQGSYEVIGRYPESSALYSGTVAFELSDSNLKVIRVIDGVETVGKGRIETATADKRRVLRVRFTVDDKKYDATYLIESDLDNYARLTGYVYLKSGATIKPGIEALFPR